MILNVKHEIKGQILGQPRSSNLNDLGVMSKVNVLRFTQKNIELAQTRFKYMDKVLLHCCNIYET